MNSSLSDEFLAVLAAMMDKDPLKRIATCDEVVRRLSAWSQAAPVASGAPPSAPDLAAPPDEFDPVYADSAEDSPSQVSQGTDPLATANQETLPQRLPLRLPPEFDLQLPRRTVALLVAPLALAAAVLLGSLLLQLLR